MNPRTKKGQRKINFALKKGKRKAQKTTEQSCENPGCGCGQ